MKTSAERKRDHDARQRALGRKPKTFWCTDREAKILKMRLEDMRKTPGK